MERSHSGRVRLLGEQLSVKADRGFESHPLRKVMSSIGHATDWPVA